MPALPYSPFWFSRRLNGLRHQLSLIEHTESLQVEQLQLLIEHTELLRAFCALTRDLMTLQAEIQGEPVDDIFLRAAAETAELDMLRGPEDA